MKCTNCGAEIKNNSKFCEFCGSSVSAQMLREHEQLNKAGCPKCGSTNITFNRERQGEVREKRGTTVVRSTVGICRDCGYTWYTDSGATNVKKRKTWLWVLGWVFIFPLPLTILLLRKKEMKSVSKYGVIAVAWLVYLIIAINGSANKEPTPGANIPTPSTAVSTTLDAKKEAHIYDSAEIKDVMNGTRTEKLGEYSIIRALSTECTEDVLADWYYNFVRKNNYNFNLIIFTDKEELTGCYSTKVMVEVGTAFIKDEYGDYSVENTRDSVIYSPSDDGKSLIEMKFNSFYITEGEVGEYGFELTLNKGTEFEETKIYYHIPEGNYTITNLGDCHAQVSVYSDNVVKNSSGWEEFAEAFDGITFGVGESGTIHIGENQCVEITEGGIIRFELN